MKIVILLLLTLLAAPKAWSQSCIEYQMQLETADEEPIFPDLNEYPLTNLLQYRIFSGLGQNIILPEDIPIDCQIRLTKNLAQNIRLRLEMEYKIAGFYLGNRQDHPFLKAIDQLKNIDESLNMPLCFSDESFDKSACQQETQKILPSIESMDEILKEIGRMIKAKSSKIQRRFEEGFIPSCLLNNRTMACAHDSQNDACLTQLQNLWWDFDYLYSVFNPEPIIEKPSSDLLVDASKGSDSPLLFSGGFHHLLFAQALTCSNGIQKGGTCTIYSGSSLLSHYCDTPAKNPLVDNQSCSDQGPGYCCASDEDVIQKAFELGIWKAKRVDAQGHVLGPSPEGTNDLEPLQIGANPSLIDGRSGAYITEMDAVYQLFGFKTLSHNVNSLTVDWNGIFTTLDEGNPIQAGYCYTDPKNPTDPKKSHAVIFEGHLAKKWIFVRNSNLSHIQVFDIDDLKIKNPVHAAVSVRPIVNFNSMAPACQQ